MLNRNKAMWARLWRRRGRRTNDHEFYDQHEASPYRSEAEARGSWNPPGGDSMWGLAPRWRWETRARERGILDPLPRIPNSTTLNPRPTTIKREFVVGRRV